jgi:hypothetical protein
MLFGEQSRGVLRADRTLALCPQRKLLVLLRPKPPIGVTKEIMTCTIDDLEKYRAPRSHSVTNNVVIKFGGQTSEG